MWALLVLALLVPELVMGGTIARPTKSNLLTTFTNGMTPNASDLNGDPDTIYAEFNGNISNVNLSASAAIAASKINPDGFTVNIRTVNGAPCTVLEESDQGSDAKRWQLCVTGGVLQLSTASDAGATQNTWLSFNRANGGFTIGGTGGTNTVNGATTFNQLVTFSGGNNLMPTGSVTAYVNSVAPSGWLSMNGAVTNCTGSGGINGALCSLLIGGGWPKASAAATITVDTSSNEIVHSSHGKTTGDRVHFGSTGTLASPLTSSTVYCIISTTTDRFKISTTCGGGEVDITTSGSGTQSDYFNFTLPDARSRSIKGSGQGSGLSNYIVGGIGGEETHVLSTGEMPSHTHSYTNPGGPSFNSAGGAQPIVSTTGSTTTGATGGGGAHNVMDPYLVLNWIIKL